MTSQQQRFVKVTDVNPHLLCVLCGGYYVDATTIIECLHSFCKSCIVRYLETNKYCPICDVQVHKTKPLLNIRSDRTLQAIVNKLVPGLFQKELSCRKEFYKNHLKTVTSNGSSSADKAEECPIFLPDEPILLGIQYINPTDGKGCNKRYLQCPAAITVYHLQKLMRAKFNLNPSQMVEFLCDGDPLPDFMSLMDLAYMYNWKRKTPVELGYRLMECQQKRIKLTHEETAPSPATGKTTSQAVEEKEAHLSRLPLRPENQPDREVQLQISENGVMSVQSVDGCSSGVTPDTAVLSSNVESKPSSVDSKPVPKRSSPFKDLQPKTKKFATCLDSISVTNHLPLTTTANNSSSVAANPVAISSVTSSTSVTITTVQTTSTAKSQEPSQDKPNHPPPVPVEEGRRETKNVENKCKSNVNNNSIRPNHISQIAGYHPINVPNTSVTVQKVYPGAVRDNSHPSRLFKMKDARTNVKEHEASLSIVRTTEKPESKPTSNVKYPTLHSSVKQWNPSIPRSTIMAMKQAQHANEEKMEPGKTANKSPKFFKMRNMPRFLGNPASGVKPMYQVLSSPEPSAQSPQTSTSQNNKPNSEVTVMKIDPKTLNPIPVTRPPKSPKISTPPGLNRLPMFVNSQPKTSESSVPVGRTQIRNPVSKNTSSFKTNPNQVHGVSLPTSPSLQTNPFLLPPHPSQHMMYGGFPRPFPPVNSASGRLPSESQILRAMSMFCSPNAAYHPSLPPPISMLFNPHHPHHRTNNDKMKYAASEFHKPSSTPSVQRVPPSGAKHPPAAHGSVDANKTNSSRREQAANNTAGKSHNPEKNGGTREAKDDQSAVREVKTNQNTPVSSAQEVISAQEPVQNRPTRDSVPLSNGYPEPPRATSSPAVEVPSKPSPSGSSAPQSTARSKTDATDRSTSNKNKETKLEVSVSSS